MKRPAVWIAVALFVTAALIIGYRVVRLDYPLLPAANVKVWRFDMEMAVKPAERDVVVRVGLPLSRAGEVVSEERVVPGKLGFRLFREGPDLVGLWSGTPGRKGQEVGYSATILVRTRRLTRIKPPALEAYPASFGKMEIDVAERLAARWSNLPPLERLRAIGATPSDKWGDPAPARKDLEAWSSVVGEHGQKNALLALLRASGIPARVGNGLILTESVTTVPARWIVVWIGQDRVRIHPETGMVYDRSVSFLPLTTGDKPPVQASGKDLPEVRWILTQQVVSQWQAYFDRINQPDRILNRLSLFTLPQDFQATFRILLLVPIGAVMICLLRNIIGFPTFGIFMPVLLALAFRSTGLGFGLGIFAGVILVGYFVRLFLDRLRLLLVPRLSVILTLVIGCFTFLAIVGNKLEIRAFMAVGLLPFVILTMMIERFFVVVEEAGAKEGFKTAAGSAAVAAITHEIIHIETLQFTFFIYPELLLVVAGILILIGRYTGYRLSELVRFRAMRRD
jgi:hypothetical protein